jgi:hypothetical protein
MASEFVHRIDKSLKIARPVQRLEQVGKDSHDHFAHLADIILALPSLVALLNFLFEFFVGQISNHILDPQVTVIVLDVRGIPRNQDVIRVTDGPVSRRDQVVPGRLAELELHSHIVPCREAPTRHVTWSARQVPLTPHVVVVVRVVNCTRLDGASSPAECGVALRTEHLVTPVNLENHRSALGAVARIALEHLGRLEAVGIARVLGFAVSAATLVTVGTGPHLTQTALPRSAQKALAVRVRASPDKLSALNSELTVHATYQKVALPLQKLDVEPKRVGHLLLVKHHGHVLDTVINFGTRIVFKV